MAVQLYLSIPELKRVAELFGQKSNAGDDYIMDELNNGLSLLAGQDIELNATLAEQMAAVKETKSKLERLHKKVGER